MSTRRFTEWGLRYSDGSVEARQRWASDLRHAAQDIVDRQDEMESWGHPSEVVTRAVEITRGDWSAD